MHATSSISTCFSPGRRGGKIALTFETPLQRKELKRRHLLRETTHTSYHYYDLAIEAYSELG